VIASESREKEFNSLSSGPCDKGMEMAWYEIKYDMIVGSCRYSGMRSLVNSNPCLVLYSKLMCFSSIAFSLALTALRYVSVNHKGESASAFTAVTRTREESAHSRIN